MKSLIDDVREHGYAIAHTGVLSDRRLLALATRFGELWDASVPIIDVRVEPEALAAALSCAALPPHCECAYDPEPPRYVLLHCTAPGDAGGDFFLVRMHDVLARLRPADRQALRTTGYRVTARSGESSTRPLITSVAGVGDVLVLTSNHYTSHDCAAQLLLRRVSRAAADPALRITHRWRRGDVVVIDNARFLHGREGFEGRQRHIKHIRIGRFTA